MRGATIQYAEVDGIAVCILDDGQWCEREMGHDGAHVIASAMPEGKTTNHEVGSRDA